MKSTLFYVVFVLLVACNNKQNSHSNTTQEEIPLIELVNPEATKEDRMKELETLPQDGTYEHVRYMGIGEETNRIEIVYSTKNPVAYMYIFTKDGYIYKEALEKRRLETGEVYFAEHYIVSRNGESVSVSKVGEKYFEGSLR